ncbi:MAG: hypothetical protein ACOYVD_04955 [Bacillota bacterium]
MYLIAITNWKRKLVYLSALLLIVILLISIIPNLLQTDSVNTDSEPSEDDILNQPIKVQGQGQSQTTSTPKNPKN